MLEGKRLLAVVPARGGSKGVPLKNIRLLAGRPLLAYVADVVRQLEFIDKTVVSTDHPEIMDVARQVGLSVPFTRPPELSGDIISDLDVLTHALTASEQTWGERFDVVIMLQPTAPLRTAKQVDAVLRKLVTGGYDAVWTVSPTDLKYHPLKQLVLDDSGSMGYFDPRGPQIIARQQLAPVYHRNGGAYAFTRSCLLEQKSIMGARTAGVVVHDPYVNIDTLDDFARAEELLKRRAAVSDT